MVNLHETLEPIHVLKQVYVDRLVGVGQPQAPVQIGPLRDQLVQQPMMRGQHKIAVESKLLANHGVLIRQHKPAGQRRVTARRRNPEAIAIANGSNCKLQMVNIIKSRRDTRPDSELFAFVAISRL